MTIRSLIMISTMLIATGTMTRANAATTSASDTVPKVGQSFLQHDAGLPRLLCLTHATKKSPAGAVAATMAPTMIPATTMVSMARITRN